MQSSMLHFCEECGAANAEDATACVACQCLLATEAEMLLSLVPQPVKIVPAVPLQVVAGSPAASGPLGSGVLLAGRYRILREIGQGGFGSVYRARDTRQRGRLVAIKQIDLHKLKPQEVIEATDTFNREVTLLSALNHPNLPKMYAHFTDASHWYLVMEYISGQTLEEYLKRSRRGHLSLKHALKIGLALANVLAYLHEQRPAVIFRDVKPANVMLTRTGQVYLIDFGIARRFSAQKKKDTGPLGSPGFAAPEQYGRAQSDQRTDIYGLGATLQTLLTGRDPLELRVGQPSLRTKLLPVALRELLASMLEADATKRPKDMQTIAECLEKLIRRWHHVFSFGTGLLIGSIFPICYLVIANLASVGRAIYDPLNPAAQLYSLAVFLDSFLRIITFGTILLLVAALIRGVNKRWFVIGMLAVLITMVLLGLLNLLPPVYVP